MKKGFIVIITVLFLLLIAFTAWKIFGPGVSTPAGEYFYVKTGDNVSKVRRELLDKKYIPNSGWFDLLSRVLKYKNAKPGRYKLKKQMSLYHLIKMLRNGDQAPVSFVITKLRTKEDFAKKAGAVFECDSLQIIRFLNNPDSIARFGIDTNTVTALMMPYTYSLNWNTTPGKIIPKLYTAYQVFWNDERKEKAAQHHLTPLQVVTIASIVEEETRVKADKSMIASVYLNRMQTGMPLQADPTVKFALKDFGLKRIYSGHLKVNSPYNTYMYAGLPPGPICTPSIETIDAVLEAPKTDYLYFVASSNFDGTSVFTTNLKDHAKYARAYQQALNVLMDTTKKANPK